MALSLLFAHISLAPKEKLLQQQIEEVTKQLFCDFFPAVKTKVCLPASHYLVGHVRPKSSGEITSGYNQTNHDITFCVHVFPLV